MKALFLVGRPGHSTVIMDSYPWERAFFRFENEAAGDVRQKDEELLDFARQMQPDVVVYVAVCVAEGQPNRGVPYDATFRTLRAIVPTVAICCDGGDSGWERSLHRYWDGGCFDSIVNIDGVLDWPLKDKKGCWVGLNPWPWPKDLPIRPISERPVPFGFHGAIGLGTRRHQLTEELRRTAGLQPTARGCVSDPRTTPYAEYARRLTDFRIGLNMAWSGTESCLHVKGRVLEYGWAGCCLLENKGSWTRQWFDPEYDYLEYKDADDAVMKVRYLLMNPVGAQAIANNLRRKVSEQHNAERFWTKVLGEVGVKHNAENSDGKNGGPDSRFGEPAHGRQDLQVRDLR